MSRVQGATYKPCTLLISKNMIYDRIRRRNYYLQNKERVSELGKIWYQNNKERKQKTGKTWTQNHRKRIVEIVQAYVKRNKPKVLNYRKRYEASQEGLYRTTKFNAERRDYEFLLTKEEFIGIISNSCMYCGENEKRIGIDRVDNRKGYTKKNSAPCCQTCNYMKRILTKQEFMSHIEKIYKYNQIVS